MCIQQATGWLRAEAWNGDCVCRTYFVIFPFFLVTSLGFCFSFRAKDDIGITSFGSKQGTVDFSVVLFVFLFFFGWFSVVLIPIFYIFPSLVAYARPSVSSKTLRNTFPHPLISWSWEPLCCYFYSYSRPRPYSTYPRHPPVPCFFVHCSVCLTARFYFLFRAFFLVLHQWR